MYNKLLRQSWGAATQGQRAPAIPNGFINSLDHAIQYGNGKSCDCVGLGMTTSVDMLSAPPLTPLALFKKKLKYFLITIPLKRKKKKEGGTRIEPFSIITDN